MGMHSEHIVTSQRGNSRVVSTTWTDDDVIHYADPDVPRDSVSIKSHSTYIISDDKVIQANGSLNMLLNRRQNEELGTVDANHIDFYANGFFSLSNMIDDGVAAHAGVSVSLDSLLSSSQYHVLPQYTHSYFASRMPLSASSFRTLHRQPAESNACPSGYDWCRSATKLLPLGNSNAGLSIKGYAGLHTYGYISQSDNPIIHPIVEANVSILFVGSSYDALSLHADADLTTAKQSPVTFTVTTFGAQVFKRVINITTQYTKTFSLGKLSPKSCTIKHTFVVYGVSLTPSVTLQVEGSAQLTGSFVLVTSELNVSADPQLTFTLTAAAEVSVGVAKAGLELTGAFTDKLIPGLYARAQTFTAKLYLDNEFAPAPVKLSAYYEVGKILSWLTKNKRKSYDLWSYSFSKKTQSLYAHTWKIKV